MNTILMAVLTAGVIVGLDHNIVSPAWLEQNLDNPYVVVMEIGSTADRPHIPGARFITNRDARVVVYCRTGMDASVPYFVLRSLGYDVALYDGSYAEWSRDRSLPVARLSFKK